MILACEYRSPAYQTYFIILADHEIIAFCFCVYTAADYSCELTTGYHQQDYDIVLFIGLIAASICVSLIVTISIVLVIVVCCIRHRKVSKKYCV